MLLVNAYNKVRASSHSSYELNTSLIPDDAAWPHRVHSAEAAAVQHHLADAHCIARFASTASRYSKSQSTRILETSTCASKQSLRVAFPTALLRGLHKKMSWNNKLNEAISIRRRVLTGLERLPVIRIIVDHLGKEGMAPHADNARFNSLPRTCIMVEDLCI